MPRSYESHITTLDRATGRERSQVVSMNHPVEHGGYTFYQMRMSEPDRLSVLGVSRDPGKPIVFTGYMLLLLGMTITLGTRVVEQRRAARRRSPAAAVESGA
jgi:cytochrome c biogenesis protein ResB